MTGKTSKHFAFEVSLNWLADTRGILTAKDAHGTIHVATPPEFGGEGKPWTPEHLFLASISSCFMTTYLAFAKKLHFGISHLECNAIGQIEIIDGRYKFTTIDLYPVIFIADEELREKANQAVEKTHRYCLISNSVNADIYYHTEVSYRPANQMVTPLKPVTSQIVHDELHRELDGKKVPVNS